MSFYPQVGNGVVTQFPFARTRQWRAIANQMEGGELITLPDSSGGHIRWSLRYEDLSAEEASAIGGLFTASQGQFGSFTFVDPMANLLGWSEDFSRAGWQLGQLTAAAGLADPLGTMRATGLSNGTAGLLQITQTLGVSGDYVACFSAYVRSASGSTVTMQRDAVQTVAAVGAQWQRLMVFGRGTAGAAQSTFAIGIPAGQSIQVFGLQAEAQPAPSVYRATAAATGIYEETYFANDELTITSTGLGLSRTSIELISRV